MAWGSPNNLFWETGMKLSRPEFDRKSLVNSWGGDEVCEESALEFYWVRKHIIIFLDKSQAENPGQLSHVNAKSGERCV